MGFFQKEAMKIHFDPNQLKFNAPGFYIHVEQTTSRGESPFPQKKTLPKLKKLNFPNSAFHRDELRLKCILADHLMKQIGTHKFDLDLASQRSQLAPKDLLNIAKGNVGAIGFFQLLSGLMHLRYDVHLRLVDHHENRDGEMSIHY